MIKCRDELDRFREKHAVAENVATHVADAGDGERVLLRVQTLLMDCLLYTSDAADDYLTV